MAAPTLLERAATPRARGERWVGKARDLIAEPERFQSKGDVDPEGVGYLAELFSCEPERVLFEVALTLLERGHHRQPDCIAKETWARLGAPRPGGQATSRSS